MRKLTVLLLAFVIALPQIPADAQARRSSSNSSTSTSTSSSTTQTPKRQSTATSSSTEQKSTSTQTPKRQSTTSTASQQKSNSTTTQTPKRSSTPTTTNSGSKNTTQPLASARRGVKTIERTASTPQAPVILGDNKPENPKPSTKYTATEMTYRHSPQYQQNNEAKLPPPPRERASISYKRPANHFHPYEHFYGYRIKRLPCCARHVFYCGVEFYYYRGIYFRLYDRHYVVCRPPYETVISVSMMRDMRFAPVRFFYYDVLDRPFEIANANYRYIQEQNAIIARNNAIIARQNSMIQQFNLYGTRSEAAYQNARFLGLSQSYAFADAEYFYEDGVFYILDRDCYRVIVPPAGAIVDSIPEDYELITLADGHTYYLVDDTVYSLTVYDGNACFEVLGQLYR